MLFEELLKAERAEGRVEGRADSILTLLEDIGEIPEELREKITKYKQRNSIKQNVVKVSWYIVFEIQLAVK